MCTSCERGAEHIVKKYSTIVRGEQPKLLLPGRQRKLQLKVNRTPPLAKGHAPESNPSTTSTAKGHAPESNPSTTSIAKGHAPESNLSTTTTNAAQDHADPSINRGDRRVCGVCGGV